MNQNVTLGHLHAIDADSWNARVAPPNCYGDARSKVVPVIFASTFNTVCRVNLEEYNPCANES